MEHFRWHTPYLSLIGLFPQVQIHLIHVNLFKSQFLIKHWDSCGSRQSKDCMILLTEQTLILIKNYHLLFQVNYYTLKFIFFYFLGSICMTWINCHEDTVPKIEVKLDILPLMQCIRSCMPINNDPPKSLRSILHSVITGALL